MNRRLFIFVIILMGISLSGIILLQLFWIRNAINIREDHFDKTVNVALRETANKLESHENILLLSEKICDYAEPSIRTKFISDSKGDDSVFIYGDTAISSSYSYSVSTVENSDVVVEVWSDTDEDLELVEYKHEITADSIRRIVSILNKNGQLDTLSKVFTHDIVFVGEHGDTVVEGTDEGYFIIKKAQTLNEAFIKMAYEIEVSPAPIHERIDTTVLLKVLTTELFDKGILSHFEYGIMQTDSISFFPLKSAEFDTLNIERKYLISLFPNELDAKSNFLVVQFPERNIHLIKSMAWTLAGSLLLTFIILITFGITIFMILRQKKLSDIKSDFINNMTHEFKTPIATISLAVDSINTPKIIGNEKQIKFYTGIIREENQRMNSQVENVLRMSLLDKHDLEFNFVEIDIHAIIEKTVSKVSLLLKERKGSISLMLESEDPILRTDPDHLINALLNLLDNAIKYSEGAPVIEVSTKDIPDGLSICIKDQGMGMSKDVIHKIFNKFYRRASGNIHNIKGFGLGLSYVKAIINAFGGKITVKSEQGKGSIFEIILPRER